MGSITSGIIAALIGLVLVIISLVQELVSRRKKKKEPTLQDRISNLTKNLESAVAVITEIEGEISKRKDLAIQLEADVERYNQLLRTNRAQVEAIAQTLEIPIRKESRKSFWLNFVTNFGVAAAFFALGYFVGGK